MHFENRDDAGKKLAEKFASLKKDFSKFQVVGLARGGVIVAKHIALTLSLPLQSLSVDDFIIHEENGGGILAITSLGTASRFKTTRNYRLIHSFFPDVTNLAYSGLSHFLKKLIQKNNYYNHDIPFSVEKKIILIDDGIASGKTAIAAITGLKYLGTEEIILGIPAIPSRFKYAKRFNIVTWRISKFKQAPTGKFYWSFNETSDQEVANAIRIIASC